MATLRVYDRITRIPQAAWDRLAGGAFSEWAWLAALEETGCAVPDEGWVPRHLTVWEDDALVAAAPTYIKLHSMGEFVYDWSWAHAARQLGVDYYPKVVVGVPFTPATGRRLLTAPDRERAPLVELLVAGLHELARMTDCAGIHVLFNTPEEAAALEEYGAETRLQFQFHWNDDAFGDWEGFLSRFRSKSRNKLRRERRRVVEAGIDVRVLEGEAIEPAHVEAMHTFYEGTAWRFGGHSYLKPAFWREVQERFGHRLHLVMAFEDGHPIAGAFNIRGADRLYGRYWGALEDRHSLHFEVCYYQPIEYCLANGLSAFEPGHGGGHKYPRGFEPALCYSSHWLRDPRLAGPIARHLEQERRHVRQRVEALRAQSPLRRLSPDP
ncbi:MAG: GNAT family N-acetyltransferase [Alphaproteobacteria bacterium]|nr:GNAT family N-acetyltransferase [Alphaproteobacteria bacterium]